MRSPNKDIHPHDVNHRVCAGLVTSAPLCKELLDTGLSLPSCSLSQRWAAGVPNLRCSCCSTGHCDVRHLRTNLGASATGLCSIGSLGLRGKGSQEVGGSVRVCAVQVGSLGHITTCHHYCPAPSSTATAPVSPSMQLQPGQPLRGALVLCWEGFWEEGMWQEVLTAEPGVRRAQTTPRRQGLDRSPALAAPRLLTSRHSEAHYACVHHVPNRPAAYTGLAVSTSSAPWIQASRGECGWTRDERSPETLSHRLPQFPHRTSKTSPG